MEMDSRLRAVEQQLNTHEAVCAERYQGIIANTARLAEDFARMNGLLTKVGLGLMVGMAGILAKLVFGG
jgi:hypothetical protein